jgi:Derlin-2/3
MPQPTAQQWWDSMPKVTKYLVVFILLLTVLTQFQVVSPYSLILDFEFIFSRYLQLWRLVTNLFYFGGFSIGLIFNLMFFIQFSSRLEKDYFEGRTADFVFMLLVGAIPMTIAAWMFGVYLLSSSLLMFLVYISCNKNPQGQLGLMFIPVTIPSRYFPWALMGLHILMGASPIPDLIGIVAGHIYHYLDDFYPRHYGNRILKTPQFLYQIFPPERFIHGLGGAQNLPQQQQRGAFPHAWGGGRRLGT